MSEYKAVVVGYNDSGILFAERSDSPEQTRQIIFGDIMRLMNDYNTKVTIQGGEDDYGDSILIAKYDNPIRHELIYKVCLEKKE